ncbi:MAG: transcription termination factor NusA [Patescibacteria group bacterium]
MFDLKNLSRAIEQIAQEKNIDKEKIMEAIESSIAVAYKKEYEKKGEVIRAKFNIKTGDVKFWQVKLVVDETTVRVVPEGEESPEDQPSHEASAWRSENKFTEGSRVEGEVEIPRYNPDRHIFINEAKKIKSEAKVGDELEFPLEPHEDFGRIAAQTAKQVILQRLREAERESIISEFRGREGEVVSGLVQRFERGNVFVDLGRAVGVMFYNESIPGERYRLGDRLKFFVLAVQEDSRMPGIILSRSHLKFVQKLFSVEVPEIADGVVEIKAIAREPGSRTKIAVISTAEGVDPVGSCVGQRGTRVMAVSNELGQEKVDIIEWSEDPNKFITNALSPAKVKSVEVLPRREARAFVAEDQLSLAIGKGGQNVRLAAKLTGWKIDVRSQANPDEVIEGGVAVGAEAVVEDGGGESKGEFIEEVKKEDKDEI